jgi:hypothetical protein
MGVLVFDGAIFSRTLYKAFTTGRGIRLLNVIVRDGVSCSMPPGLLGLIIWRRDYVLLVRSRFLMSTRRC